MEKSTGVDTVVSFLDAPKKRKQVQLLEGIVEQMEVGEADD